MRIVKRKPILLRFNKLYKIVETGCWEWQKSLMSDGYGQFFISTEKKCAAAHIVSYKLFIGEIEKGLLVCHKCDNRKCVNPFHLFKGTYMDNTMDAQIKGRIPTSMCPSERRYAKGCRCEPCVSLRRISKKLWRDSRK